MKMIVRFILVTLMASGGLGGYSFTVGKETTVGMQTREVIGKIQHFITSALPKADWLKFPSPEDEIIETYQPVLQACLGEMFFEKDGYHFSQSRWGADSVPYQFRDLEVIGPKELTLNGADRARGIEKRITFDIYVGAHRRYDRATGWSNWNPERPPNLDGITMVLHSGEWKIASSPMRSYNLK